MKRHGLSLAFALALFTAVSLPALAGDKAHAGAHQDLGGQVTLAELKQASDSGSATIIDANGASMYAEGHVPGAISFAAHEGKLSSVLPKDKNAAIIAYCGGPMCTAWQFAAKEAKTAGYTNIKHYKGGIKGWKDAGYKMDTGAKKAS